MKEPFDAIEYTMRDDSAYKTRTLLFFSGVRGRDKEDLGLLGANKELQQENRSAFAKRERGSPLSS